jgi:Polyketide cyclase / dehydrase and lipid transport
MVLKILIALVAIVAAFAGFVALQPSEYRIARSATIAAPASDVFAQVNDFHKWDAWSPWAKLDPNAKTTFEGPSAGEGAVFA